MQADWERIYGQVCAEVVGRRAEIRLILAALRARRPILMLGLPGVSKSTILRAVSRAVSGADRLLQVTGDEQMSAFTLVGSFDPAMVMRSGYQPEHFVAGPLVQAMKSGGILYVEEFNRAPSGALNVLMTALADGYLEVPRFGRVEAAPGFTLVGVCNPLDDIGTTRLSRGLADRFVLIELDYQPREEELAILARRAPAAPPALAALAVAVARRSREHPDLRYGASVRGAIDFMDLLAGVPAPDREALVAVACAAYAGKVQVKPASRRRPAEVIRELLLELVPPDAGTLVENWHRAGDTFQPDSAGGALVRAGAGQAPAEARGGAVREEEGRPPPRLVELAWQGQGSGGTRGASTRRPTGAVTADLQFKVTHAVERLTTERTAPWVTPAEVDDWAALAGAVPAGRPERSGGAARRLLQPQPWALAGGGELDLEATLAHAGPDGLPGPADLRVRVRQTTAHRLAVLVDHSGSMVGRRLAVAATAAAAFARWAAAGRMPYGVYAFDQEVTVVKGLAEERDREEVIHDLLHLPEGRSTDLGAALRVAAALSDGELPLTVLLVSDCMPTRGIKTAAGLGALAEQVPGLHVCHVGDGGAGQAQDLYYWWAQRWVGPERVFPAAAPADVPELLGRLAGQPAGALL